MSFKIFSIVLSLLLVLSVASAYSYDVKMDVYPTDGIGSGDSFLVYGYIDSNTDISDDNLQIRVYDDNGNLYKKVQPYFEGRDGSNSNKEGYFYKRISISSTGDFDVKLRVDGRTEEVEYIDVETVGTRVADVSNVKVSVDGDKIKFTMNVKNRDSEDHDITVRLKGDNNWDNPTKFTVDVDAYDTEKVTKTYDLSKFGYDNFIVAIYAEADIDSPEAYGDSEYVLVDSGNSYYNRYDYDYPYTSFGYGNIEITNIELQNETFYPGDVIEGYVTLKNHGSQESQYRFEYIVNNKIFKNGDVGYIQPGYTETETIVIEVPETDSFKITAKTNSGGQTDMMDRTFLVSHKFKYFSPYLSESSVSIHAGDNYTIDITLMNKGNEDDSYKMRLDGWDFYTMKNTAAVKAGEQKEFNITFEIPENTYVGVYPVTLEICNLQGVCKTKDIEMTVTKTEAEQSEVTWSENQSHQYFEENETLIYTITLKNLELNEKEYAVIVDIENATLNISEETFGLQTDETKEIVVEITPENKENMTATLRVNSEGEQILSKELELEYTTDKKKALGLTGFFIFDGEFWVPGLFILAFIGAGTLVFLSYRILQNGTIVQKVNLYKKQKAKRLVTKPMQPKMQYIQRYTPQQQMPPRQMPQYDSESFMRRM